MLPAEKNENVSAIVVSEQSIQVGVGAGVERVEEDEKDLGVGDIDEWISSEGSESEEGYGGPAGEVREHEECHPLGHRHIGVVEGVPGLPTSADAAVHPSVAEANDPEGDAVEDEECRQVSHVDAGGLLQGEANAATS